MLTVLEILKKTTEFFAGRGIESPRLNAELLVGHALGLKRMQLYLQFERPLSEPELALIRPLVRRRAQHEPLQYILGVAEFHGLRLKVDRRALIPRPETELLVEQVIAALLPPPTRLLDPGTGSGAIALALASAFPAAAVVAGLSGGLGPVETISAFGRAFNDNRYISLVWLVLPAIGLLERAGLQERARDLMARARAATAGRLLLVYFVVRQLTAALGLTSLGGQAQMVRPLIAPMAEAASKRPV